MLFDTHAHYFDERFAEITGGAEKLLEDLFAGDIRYIVNAATTTRDSLKALALAEKFEGCYAAVGVHPENCDEEESVGETVARLRALLKRPKVVAIGETGLDYHWQNNPPREKQKEYFIAQLDLARETGFPVVVHGRDAHGDVFEILSRYPDVVCILHSFSGSPETARQYLMNRNRYIGFSGVLTYKNAVQPVEVAKIVPADRMLSETDCPYLTPVPWRGKINHSGYMIETVKKLAEIKQLDLEETKRILTENAKRVFRIDR
ncbi:MAG: TatD family hydrolase [Clostridia bacterium]|nr:TatD family hydrolase [Clostridia bacterium]